MVEGGTLTGPPLTSRSPDLFNQDSGDRFMHNTENGTMVVSQPSAAAGSAAEKVAEFKKFCEEKGNMSLTPIEFDRDTGLVITARAFSGTATCPDRTEIHTARQWLGFVVKSRDLGYSGAAMHALTENSALPDGDYSLSSLYTVARIAHILAGVKFQH